MSYWSNKNTEQRARWRKGRDSNPGYPCGYTDFPGLPDKPLLHPSTNIYPYFTLKQSKKPPGVQGGLGKERNGLRC